MTRFIFPIVFSILLYSHQAWAWWEASLQQVEVSVLLTQNGGAHIEYDLRYHVDRGRFEGIEINNPERVIQWDRPNSYIEDAQGRRYPIFIIRRGRDGAYLVRLARHSGLRRGFVTVHLAYNDDLRNCCYRIDPNGQPRLDWHGFYWDVGMDRINVTFHTDPAIEELEPVEELSTNFNIVRTSNGLIIERLRPVRWYEMHVGLFFPENWLSFQPSPMAIDPSAPLPHDEEMDSVILPSVTQEGPDSSLIGLLYAMTAIFCLFLLAIKYWLTSEAYKGTTAPAPFMILPQVPSLVRWTFIGVAVLAGAWLQSSSFLSAGTLSFVGGILLCLRAPFRKAYSVYPDEWTTEKINVLKKIIQRQRFSRKNWAILLDGTSWIGLPLALVSIGGTTFFLYWLQTKIGSGFIDGIGINIILTLSIVFFTNRKQDSIPHSIEMGAILLFKTWRKLYKATQSWGVEGHLLVGSQEDGGEPQKILLTFSPAPIGIESIVVGVEPRLGLLGWVLNLVAKVETTEGKMFTLRSRKAGKLSRQLNRKVKKLKPLEKFEKKS